MIWVKLFPVISMRWKIYFFPIILINKDFIFDILSGWLLICSWFNATAIEYWKHLSSLFFGFIIVFLFFNQLWESVYDPPQFKLNLLRF